MLRNLRIRNYKAFEDASIPIKPITILLGANSVGKSSIIQMLLLLQQTAKEDVKSYKSALKLYGGAVNLGDAKNLFRKQDVSRDLEIGFSVFSEELSSYFKALLNDYVDHISDITRYIPIKAFLELRHKDIKNRNDYKIYIDKIIEIINKDSKAKDYIEQIKTFLKFRANIDLKDLESPNKSNLLRTYDFLDKLSSEKTSHKYHFDFKIRYDKNKLSVFQYQISINHKTIIKFTDSSDEEVLFSDLIKYNINEKKEIKSLFNKENTIFNCFPFESNSSTVVNYTTDIIKKTLLILKKEFSEYNINYVSPLRAHPKRYYMLDKAKMNISLDTLDGDAIADVLKENSKLSKNVNDWLAKFKLSVNVEEFKEVVHHLVVFQNNLKLNITDVGFGISQILPVIIQGFLSPKNSTTIIEQPEIHLHPQMQADLADLFIAIIKNTNGKRLIIETHSEYLLKRLRRRISEQKIDPEDVAICLFHPQSEEHGAEIENLAIENKGYFEWPEDFYGGELYEDTIRFLKNQE